MSDIIPKGVPAALLAGLCTVSISASAAVTPDFTELSLQDLMKVEITSVSKRPQELGSAAAAIFVITQEDLKRSGATSIPEALRLVPGLEVARINASTWAISSRGFNGRFANKLQVLIDGRSVYTPLFSGVFWDQQDTLLANIDRIEVIRGPGAALWGSNAVNGVINIITKPADQTQGNYVQAGGGLEEQAFGAAQHGGTIGQSTFFRTFVKGFQRDSGPLLSGADGGDEWKSVRGGLRLDGTTSVGDSWRILSEAYGNTSGETFPFPSLTAPYTETRREDIDISGGHVLAGWERKLGDGSQVSGQVYYDRTQLSSTRTSETRDTIDVQLEHSFSPLAGHDVVWGAGYRHSWDRTTDTFNIAFDPDNDAIQLVSTFVQDTIALIPSELALTIGTKLEQTEYTGFSLQPSARAAWQPDAQTTIWGAVSRAVRTPSRAENDVRLNRNVIEPFGSGNPTPFPAVVAIFGDRETKPETLTAFELGTRFQATPALSFDLATYYNIYRNLTSVEQGTAFIETSPGPTHLVVPLFARNQMHGTAYGFELLGTWRVDPQWRLQGGYSFLNLDVASSGSASGALNVEGNSPQNQLSVRSQFDLSARTTFDVALRYVGELAALNVDDYVALDARFGYQIAPGTEIAVIGRNLLAEQHVEFGSDGTLGTFSTQAERSLFVMLERKF